MSVEQAVVRTDRDPEGPDSMRTEEGYTDWVMVVPMQFELFRRVWSSLPGCQMALNVKVNSLLGRRIDVSGRGWTDEQLERARLRYRKMVEEYMRDTTCYGIFLCTVDERTRLPHRIDPASVRIWSRRTSHDVGEYVIIRPESGAASSRRVRLSGVAVFERCKPLPNGTLDSPLRPLLPEIRLANSARVCSIIAMRQNAYPLMFTTAKQPDDPGSNLQRQVDTGEFNEHARNALTQHELDAQQKARTYDDAMQRAMMVHRRDRMSANPTRLGMGTLLDEETDTLTFDLLGTEEPNLYPLPMGATPVAATAAQEPATLVVTNARIDAMTCRIMGVSPAVLGGGENKTSGAEGSVTGMVIGYTEMAAAERHQLASLFNIISPVTADGIDIEVLCNNEYVQSADGDDDDRTVESRNDVELGWNLSDDILKQFAAMSGEKGSPKKKLFRREGPRTYMRRDAALRMDWSSAAPKPLRSKRKSVWVAADVLHSKRRRRPRSESESDTDSESDGNSDTSSSKSESTLSSSSEEEEKKDTKGKKTKGKRVSKSPPSRDAGKASSRSKSTSNSKAASSSSSTSTSSSEDEDEDGKDREEKKKKETDAEGPKGEGKEEKKRGNSPSTDRRKKSGRSTKKAVADEDGDEKDKTAKKRKKKKRARTREKEEGDDDGGEKDDGEKTEKEGKKKRSEKEPPTKDQEGEGKKQGDEKKKRGKKKDGKDPRSGDGDNGPAKEVGDKGEDLETERKRLEMQRKERVKEAIEMHRLTMKMREEDEKAHERKAEETRRRQLQTVSRRLRERARQTGTSVRLPSHLRTLAQGGKRGPLTALLGPLVEVNAIREYLREGLVTVQQTMDVLVDVHGFRREDMPTELLDPVTQRPLAEVADRTLESNLQVPGAGPISSAGNDRVAPRGMQAPGLREKKPGAAAAAHHGIQSK